MSAVNDADVIARMLTTDEVWAVVGLSSNRTRDAYRIAQLLQRRGKRIIPVHPSAESVHGEAGYPSLAQAQQAVGRIDVVDVFVNADLAGAVADEAIGIGARGVWFQLGVIDPAAADRVLAAGLDMVMDRCPAIEWPKLGRINDRSAIDGGDQP